MNKVILMGRLTNDLEIRYSTNGNNTAVCRFTMAVDREFWKTGEDRKADFINCTAFGKTGEFISKYFTKGSMIAVVGSIQTRSWDDAEGKKQYATDVIIEKAYFTGSKSNNTVNPNSEPQGEFIPLEDEDLPF